MSRYRKITIGMWGDAKFRKLSSPQPNAQSLWIYLLTGPHTGPIPGLSIAGEAALAEALDWPLPKFRRAFAEIADQGMADADWKARVLFLPRAIIHNAPESPNVVRTWRSYMAEVAECPLKAKAEAVLEGWLEAKGKAWREAFGEALALSGAVAGEKLNRRKAEHEQDQPQPLGDLVGHSNDNSHQGNGSDSPLRRPATGEYQEHVEAIRSGHPDWTDSQVQDEALKRFQAALR